MEDLTVTPWEKAIAARLLYGSQVRAGWQRRLLIRVLTQKTISLKQRRWLADLITEVQANGRS